MEAQTVSLVVDAKGLACPMPIFKAKKGLQTVELGEVVEVLCTDPGSLADFKAFANSTGHELMLSEQNGTVYRFLLRRAK
ncbi:MAG: sulfurtransferase TusA family protein [Thermaerobacter sp.]|nr:sulfurtransferase TusA family protein [Thermaerobacter sp.]